MESAPAAPPPYAETADYKTGIPPPAYGASVQVQPPSTNGITPQDIMARPPGFRRTICRHCNQPILIAIGSLAPAKCPKCHKVLGKTPKWAKKRAIIYLVLGIIFLALGIGTTVATYVIAMEGNGGFYVVNYGSMVAGVIYLVLALFYKKMKVTKLEPGVVRSA